MKLEEFLKRLDLGLRQFAKYSSIHPNTVLDVLNGCESTYKTIEIIMDRTFGLVTFEDLKPTQKRIRRTKATDISPADQDLTNPWQTNKKTPQEKTTQEDVSRNT